MGRMGSRREVTVFPLQDLFCPGPERRGRTIPLVPDDQLQLGENIRIVLSQVFQHR